MILVTPYIYKNRYKKICYSINKEWGEFLKFFKQNWLITTPEFKLKNYNLKKIKLVVISGGGNLSKIEKKEENFIRDKFEKKIISECIKYKIPILAVCRGFQLIAQIYKGEIVKDIKHLKKHQIKITSKKKIKTMNVNSNHQYLIKKLESFECIGFAKDGSIEMAYNQRHKIFCTMFHPERLSTGKKYIYNLLKYHIKI